LANDHGHDDVVNHYKQVLNRALKVTGTKRTSDEDKDIEELKELLGKFLS